MTQTLEKVAPLKLKRVRIVLIDDHAMVRDSLASWLSQETDIEVVAVAPDADAGTEAVLDMRPDVVLMDIDMPGLSCFDAARQILRQLPEVHIVFLSAFTNDSYIQQALAVEARGYLTKRETPGTIVEAIRSIVQGGVHFSKEVQGRIVIDGEKVRLEQAGEATCGSTLTARELEVLRYIARGMAKKDIGTTMHLSVKTVENHSNSIMTKLRIHNRVELARYAIREGLAEA